MRITRTHFGLELHDTLIWDTKQRSAAIHVRERVPDGTRIVHQTRYKVFPTNVGWTERNRRRAIQRAEDWALQNGS